MEIPQAITDARSEAARLGAAAGDYAAASYTIPDQLKKYVQEALDYNKDVIGMRSQALADYQASPAQANAKFGVQQFQQGPTAGQANPDYIFNPFERNSAIQSFITNQGVPFSFANTLLGMREGTIADTVDAGTRAFQAQAAATQAAANAARQTYQDVLNEFVQMTQLDQEQQRIDKPAAGSGGVDWASLLGGLGEMVGNQGEIDLSGAVEDDTPTDAVANLPAFKPQYNPFASPVAGQSASLAPVKPKPLPSANIKAGALPNPNSPVQKLRLNL